MSLSEVEPLRDSKPVLYKVKRDKESNKFAALENVGIKLLVGRGVYEIYGVWANALMGPGLQLHVLQYTVYDDGTISKIPVHIKKFTNNHTPAIITMGCPRDKKYLLIINLRNEGAKRGCKAILEVRGDAKPLESIPFNYCGKFNSKLCVPEPETLGEDKEKKLVSTLSESSKMDVSTVTKILEKTFWHESLAKVFIEKYQTLKPGCILLERPSLCKQSCESNQLPIDNSLLFRCWEANNLKHADMIPTTALYLGDGLIAREDGGVLGKMALVDMPAQYLETCTVLYPKEAEILREIQAFHKKIHDYRTHTQIDALKNSFAPTLNASAFKSWPVVLHSFLAHLHEAINTKQAEILSALSTDMLRHFKSKPPHYDPRMDKNVFLIPKTKSVFTSASVVTSVWARHGLLLLDDAARFPHKLLIYPSDLMLSKYYQEASSQA